MFIIWQLLNSVNIQMDAVSIKRQSTRSIYASLKILQGVVYLRKILTLAFAKTLP